MRSELAHDFGVWNPRLVLPGVVYVGQVLGRSPTVAVACSYVECYPEGLRFLLSLAYRPSHEPSNGPEDLRRRVDEFFGLDRSGGHPRFDAFSEGALRISLTSGDWTVTTDGSDKAGQPPTGVSLTFLRGSGGTLPGGEYQRTTTLWLRPLPTGEQLILRTQWPTYSLTSHEVNIPVAPLIAASRDAKVIWEA